MQDELELELLAILKEELKTMVEDLKANKFLKKCKHTHLEMSVKVAHQIRSLVVKE